MKLKSIFICLAIWFGCTLAAVPAMAAIATFDDLTPTSDYTGPGGGAYYNGSDAAGGFQSGDFWFSNNYDASWAFWSGWAYSNTTDTTTAGSTNQYSAISGGGANGSANYGIAYCGDPQVIFGYNSGEYAQAIDGFYVTNTTYATLSMQNGDFYAKKFGGDDGTDPDWFKLTVYGLDQNYESAGAGVEFYLADYRYADPVQDYIVTDWTWLDLSDLGSVYGLAFELSSSDNGQWGMNTPAYFAVDDLTTVPAPAALWLLGSGLVGLIGVRRKNM